MCQGRHLSRDKWTTVTKTLTSGETVCGVEGTLLPSPQFSVNLHLLESKMFILKLARHYMSLGGIQRFIKKKSHLHSKGK